MLLQLRTVQAYSRVYFVILDEFVVLSDDLVVLSDDLVVGVSDEEHCSC